MNLMGKGAMYRYGAVTLPSHVCIFVLWSKHLVQGAVYYRFMSAEAVVVL